MLVFKFIKIVEIVICENIVVVGWCMIYLRHTINPQLSISGSGLLRGTTMVRYVIYQC